jgi:hypothetical protein
MGYWMRSKKENIEEFSLPKPDSSLPAADLPDENDSIIPEEKHNAFFAFLLLLIIVALGYLIYRVFF